MGELVGKAYPTKLFLGLADHTYVECGTGKVGWKCWGGKTGGREIVRGTGSTNQANAIATPNERGGITCYGINGVCHQAANRVLSPSGTLVSAAKGYWVSSSLFTTYGKENRNVLHICEAPFDQHNSVTGDMPACDPHLAAPAPSTFFMSDKHATLANAEFAAQKSFAEVAMSLQEKARSLAPDDSAGHLTYQLDHFSQQSRLRLGSLYSDSLERTLRQIRTDIEKQRIELEMAYAAKNINIKQFAEFFNKLTVKFQDDMADTLKAVHYRAYFALEQSERVILLDPEIIDTIQAGA